MKLQTKLLSFILLSVILVGSGCKQKPKEANKEEKKEVVKLSDNERMAWWRDARFGMFIHWGAYAIPGGERNGEICKGGAEWIMDKLDYTIDDYEKEVTAKFNPVKFDADAWVKMAKDAGMKYIVLTSKHHDGFCLWDSEITDYDVMEACPYKKDIVKALSEACKKADIHFCLYHSIVDWHHPQAQAPLYPNYNAGQKDQTVVNPEFPMYYENYLKPMVGELLTKYDNVDVVWFDGDWIADYTTEMGKDFYAYIRGVKPNVIVNNRVDKGRNGMEGMDKEGNFAGDFGTPEQEIPATGIDSDWESCMTMNGSWGYKPSDTNWKSSETLIQHLVDIVSKGGNFLLNIGPDASGLFPPESVERLADMGKWININGEAIYGANASPVDRPQWGRYTSKPGVVYANVFEWPEDGQMRIDSKLKVKRASLLVDGKELNVSSSDEGSFITVPEMAPDKVATVIKLELAQ
jgi:alpha-L-fucosidase